MEPVSLGTGMCRGPVWQRGVWPIARGFKSRKACAEACAKTKNCMGFDLSDETDKERFKCFLYGDRRLAPASGVPGECFTLRDRLDDLRHEDVDEDFFEDHKDDGKEIKFGECGSCSRWPEGCISVHTAQLQLPKRLREFHS